MVSCLALAEETHSLVSQREGLMVTACGMAIARRHVAPGFIADGTANLTCARCRAAGLPDTQARQRPATDAKSLVTRLFADVLNANTLEALADVAAGQLATHLSAARVGRLHELFPSWHATIDDLIGETDSAFARYRVTFIDAFGLLGPVGPAEKGGQALLAKIAGRRLVDVNPVVDDFGLWSGSIAGHENAGHGPCAC